MDWIYPALSDPPPWLIKYRLHGGGERAPARSYMTIRWCRSRDYRENLDRLERIKKQVDPGRLFDFPQAIW